MAFLNTFRLQTVYTLDNFFCFIKISKLLLFPLLPPIPHSFSQWNLKVSCPHVTFLCSDSTS